MLKVCSRITLRMKTVLTALVELDDDDDLDPAMESPGTDVLTTDDTSPGTPQEPTPTKVHTEPPA